MNNFESLEDCQKRNSIILKAIQEKSNLENIKHKIESCSEFNRCQHILCSCCKREFRCQYVPLICNFASAMKHNYNLYAVTLLEPLDFHSTKHIDVHKLKNTLFQRIKRLFGHNVIVIGGLDIAYNVDSESKWKPFFHPHWHLLFITKLDRAVVRENLKKYYVQTDIIKRPVRTVRVRSLRKCVSYMFSPYFTKRVRFLNTQSKVRNPFYDSKEYRLNKKEIQKLASRIKNYNIKDMLFLYRCRFRSDNCLSMT